MLSLPCSAQASSPEPTSPGTFLSTDELKTFEELFRSILTSTDASPEDFKRLEKFFGDLETATTRLPEQLERASGLSRENSSLKWVIVALSAIALGEGYLLVRSR